MSDDRSRREPAVADGSSVHSGDPVESSVPSGDPVESSVPSGDSVDRSSTRYGEAWVYESIVGAIPGIDLTDRQAVAIQFLLFQVGVLGVGAWYGLWEAIVAGTAAVVVAAIGSAVMLRLGAANRSADAAPAYYRLLFGSSIEVVLGLLAFFGLVTYLFVYDPSTGGPTLLERLFGPDPPLVAIYLALLVLWDLCYRIGTSWWAAVVSLWRSLRLKTPAESAGRFVRLDLTNVGFATTQVLLLPFVLAEPILFVAVAGHVLAVAVVSLLSIAVTRRRA